MQTCPRRVRERGSTTMLASETTAANVKILREKLFEACVLEQAKLTALVARIGAGETEKRELELRRRRLKMLKDMVDNFQRLLDEPPA